MVGKTCFKNTMVAKETFSNITFDAYIWGLIVTSTQDIGNERETVNSVMIRWKVILNSLNLHISHSYHEQDIVEEHKNGENYKYVYVAIVMPGNSYRDQCRTGYSMFTGNWFSLYRQIDNPLLRLCAADRWNQFFILRIFTDDCTDISAHFLVHVKHAHLVANRFMMPHSAQFVWSSVECTISQSGSFSRQRFHLQMTVPSLFTEHHAGLS